MARAGRASAALATAAIGSFVAGTLGVVGLTVAAPALAEVALRFGPAEYFALIVVAFATISSVLGASPLRGLLSLFLGLALGLVGIDLQTGQARYTFGIPHLLDGIDVVVVVNRPVRRRRGAAAGRRAARRAARRRASAAGRG